MKYRKIIPSTEIKGIVFKVINPDYIRYHYLEEDRREKFEFHRQNEKYLEDYLFFSNLDTNLIRYQVFLTYNELFLNEKFYSNYENVRSWRGFVRHLSFEDFQNVILPNFKLELIDDDTVFFISGYKYLLFNWEFYEEKSYSIIGSNTLYHFIDVLISSTYISTSKKTLKLQINGLSILSRISNVIDGSYLKGLIFYYEQLQEAELNSYEPSLIVCDEIGYYNSPYYFRPKLFNKNDIESKFDNDKKRFQKEFDELMNFFNINILPFVIVKEK